ncbi:MAG: SusD/RagB family nutrient-binding outer membrane lipoprotein, partial [Bacteroidetes bacterium]|nr:SusD/RagB family nutrient-binding outer membrane lipoprotein [Bacteroidota bacterium]
YTTPIEFGVSHPVFTPNRLAPLLSKTEELFIRAEAEFAKNGAVTSSYDAYKAAIQNSFADAGVSADFDAYWTYIDKGEASLTLNLIMTEKYKALLCNPEVFTDYRRTGVPSLKPKAGSEVPSRFPYPDTETLANSNTPSPADVTLFTKVWWDK